MLKVLKYCGLPFLKHSQLNFHGLFDRASEASFRSWPRRCGWNLFHYCVSLWNCEKLKSFGSSNTLRSVIWSSDAVEKPDGLDLPEMPSPRCFRRVELILRTLALAGSPSHVSSPAVLIIFTIPMISRYVSSWWTWTHWTLNSQNSLRGFCKLSSSHGWSWIAEWVNISN